MRRALFAIACVASVVSGAIAPVAAAAPTTAQKHAYTLSVVCWVVAAHYRNEADIHRTTDALRKMGTAMGYDNGRTAKDVTAMASALGVELRNDPRAMERHRASCRQLGLVS